eukprot:TRINITY_DN17177_c0_g1_i1.p1 TRINITY_DN17177_c0_g1~~TRINITY_DN17177_c0_g1_i1.p1  ORF type:complete len:741 (+),score=141.95 TRINITY_DN17177_c0_g1_i1:49-2223(+)
MAIEKVPSIQLVKSPKRSRSIERDRGRQIVRTRSNERVAQATIERSTIPPRPERRTSPKRSRSNEREKKRNNHYFKGSPVRADSGLMHGWPQDGEQRLEAMEFMAYKLIEVMLTGTGWFGAREICTANAGFTSDAFPLNEMTRLEEYCDYMSNIVNGVAPDLTYGITSIATSGNACSVTGHMTGTHTGPGGLVPPTSAKASSSFAFTFNFTNTGRVSRILKVWDAYSLYNGWGWMNSSQGSTEQDILCDDGVYETSQFINGQFMESDLHYTNYDPVNGEAFCFVSDAGNIDVDRAVEAAVTASKDGEWSRMTKLKRQKMIARLGTLLQRDASQLCKLESQDTGLPEDKCSRSLDLCLEAVKFYTKFCTDERNKLHATQSFRGRTHLHGGGHSELAKVVGLFLDCDYPLLRIVTLTLPALCMGCSVVVKLSKYSPLSGLAVAHLFRESGFPPGCINILVGGNSSVDTVISRHPLISKVIFSTKIQNFIENDNFAQLDTIGKGTVLVCSGADLKLAARHCLDEICLIKGQLLAFGTRVIVEDDVHKEFMKILVNQVSEMEPLSVCDPDLITNVMAYIDECLEQGAQVECGGKQVGTRFQPCVLSGFENDVPEAVDCWSNGELVSFPLVCVKKFVSSESDAVFLNIGSEPLLVFTNSEERFKEISESSVAGAIHAKDESCFDAVKQFESEKNIADLVEATLNSFTKENEDRILTPRLEREAKLLECL